MYPVLFTIGWLLAKLPKFLMQKLCCGLGLLFFWIPSKRRQIIYSNLNHAFPERSPEWLKATVRKVCIRTVEMGLLTLVIPHFSKERYFNCLEVAPESDALMERLRGQDRPILLLTTHASMLEASNAWFGVSKLDGLEGVVVYRPHKNPKIDAMIKQHRERGGIKMVSRKEGVKALSEAMRQKQIGVLLFDQNTRVQGSLIPFFGRVTAATDLPGLFAKKYQAIVLMGMVRRLGFWKGRLELEELNCELDPKVVTLESNRWLEDKLKASDDYLVDWLWSHNRWKILFRPFERLGMNHKRKITDFTTYPVRKTRIALLHGDIAKENEQALAFLKALRISRPDAEITLISRNAEVFQQANRDWVDSAHDLFENPTEDAQLAKAMRDHYLDVLLVMDDSPAMRKFAALTHVPQRFGIHLGKPSKKVAGLTHYWTPEDPFLWQMNRDWIAFGKHFGLEVPEQDAD